jgi:hypothetical protein
VTAFCEVPVRVFYVVLCVAGFLISSSARSQSVKDSSILQDSSQFKSHASGFDLPRLLTDSGRNDFYRRALGGLDSAIAAFHPSRQIKSRLQSYRNSIPTVRGKDSVLKASLKKAVVKETAGLAKQPLKFDGGFISYNWNYRSALDTPLADVALAQHLVNAGADLTIANKLPLHITYSGRETNSPFFKSYRDLRVDVDVQRYRELRARRVLQYFSGYAEGLKNGLAVNALDATALKLKEYKGLADHPELIKRLIQSKEALIRETFADTAFAYKDSIQREAKNFIRFYDSLQYIRERYTHLHDSLQQVVQQIQAKAGRIGALMNGGRFSSAEAQQMAAAYGQKDEHVRKLTAAFEGIQALSLGRTFPSYSSLTLQNVNVNGVNLEYGKNKFSAAVTAGAVDFRMRDFLFEKDPGRTPQYVYLAKLGYGGRENSVALTYFAGRKQIFGSVLQAPSTHVQGISLSARAALNRNTTIYGEIAQSAMPLAGTRTGKSSFQFSDNSQQAFAFGLNSFIPQTQTRIEARYQKTGINYQSFNSFQYNAAVNSWSAKLEQPVWKRQLVLTASLRKNDFTNPYILQRYNANTVFKTAMLTFRRTNWPVVSVGYLPVSQNIVIAERLYQNHFQALTGNLSYQYAVGMSRASTTLMYSRFFNDGNDSGFVHFNSKNLFWNQSFSFERYTANIGASVMSNNQYRLTVLDGGIGARLSQKITLDLGVKVNHLDGKETRFGFRGGNRFALNNIGEINLWAEKSYIPTAGNGFYKYEMYNLGFTRFFR